MKKYKQSTSGQRYQIYGLKQAGINGKQFSSHSWAAERLNHRPRKVLSFRSPHEVLFGVEIRYTKPALAVALRT